MGNVQWLLLVNLFVARDNLTWANFGEFTGDESEPNVRFRCSWNFPHKGFTDEKLRHFRPPLPCVLSKTSPCVLTPCAHVKTCVRVVLVHTETLWTGHTGFFPVCHTTHHNSNNTQQHTETEPERDRETRQRKREEKTKEERQNKTREQKNK